MSAVPALPVLVAGLRQAAWLSPDGESELLAPGPAVERAHATPPLVCHLRQTATRLDAAPFPAWDILTLFAFVRPARFCVPTPRGVAQALDLPPPGDLEAAALGLLDATARLLDDVAAHPAPRALAALAATMGRGGWPWAEVILGVLGIEAEGGPHALEVWRDLPEWAEHAPPPPPGGLPVTPEEARARLDQLLGRDQRIRTDAEHRPAQADYAGVLTGAFAPRAMPDTPHLVLAEAGTGIGKTLGYIAPATAWAERNEATVVLSTFTRNLQHQIDAELTRHWPDPVEKARRVVVRKGRENYLCLLNLDEAVRQIAARPRWAIPLGLMARWTAATRDGDMVGGDFPAWLAGLVGPGLTRALADRRGECIYTACPHYTRCFIERNVRRARRARIVVANHALVMVQCALGDADLPTRFVFDEGHHVFAAADGAFAAHLSGAETHDLRRWLLGRDGGSRSRLRGLMTRIGDLIASDGDEEHLDALLRAGRILPGEGWLNRLVEDRAEGPTEAFLAALRRQVHARTVHRDGPYTLECETTAPEPDLLAAAETLEAGLDRLDRPMRALANSLLARLNEEAEDLDSAMRTRLEAAARSLGRRADLVAGWRTMLHVLGREAPADFVDWMSVERLDGREVDMGLHRHWRDPTRPFIEALAGPAHGMVITSATLTDTERDGTVDWTAADQRTGAVHLAAPAIHSHHPSPFAYDRLARVFIVTDVRKDQLDQVAGAVRSLFQAAGGGALGLFTAISRLRAVHGRIAGALETAGLPLYAQHVDDLDTATLIDIFRAEPDACLLGTDAVRDGVDVPGRALRLIAFDRVPWPRPDILHKARRAAFGGRVYDDRLTRLRLKQAFGRLVRRADDVGVFVLLDPMTPSRLLDAFPPGVPIRRCGLAEAVAETRSFLKDF